MRLSATLVVVVVVLLLYRRIPPDGDCITADAEYLVFGRHPVVVPVEPHQARPCRVLVSRRARNNRLRNRDSVQSRPERNVARWECYYYYYYCGLYLVSFHDVVRQYIQLLCLRNDDG